MQDSIISAFTTKSNQIQGQLKNQVRVVYGSKPVVVTALWDTGANVSCISQSVVHDLSLIPTGKKSIQTPSGTSPVNTYLVDIVLPNNVRINDLEVCDSQIGNQGLGVLIGMDIITKGDFTVSNYNGKTVFSFRTPSMQVVDYVGQLRVANVMNNKHGKGKRKRKK